MKAKVLVELTRTTGFPLGEYGHVCYDKDGNLEIDFDSYEDPITLSKHQAEKLKQYLNLEWEENVGK